MTGRLRTALQIASLAGALALVTWPGVAGAKSVNVEGFNLLGSGPTVWDAAVDDYNGGDADIDGCAVLDGYTPVRYGTSYAGRRERANLFANGLIFGHALAEIGITPADGRGQYNAKTNSLTVSSNVLGLEMSRTDKPIGHALRTLVTMRNPTSAPIADSFSWDSRLSSVPPAVQTSSDDGVLESSDRWVALAGSDVWYGYQSLGFLLYGKGAREKVANVTHLPADQCMTVDYALSVPANSTRYMLFFTVQHTIAPALLKETKAIDRRQPPAKFLRGIPQKVRAKVLNWDL